MSLQLVSTVTVGSGGAASIQFDNIAQTGKDLLILTSARSASGGAWEITGTINSSGGTNRNLEGTGSSVSSTSASRLLFGYFTGATDTASTFGNSMAYISNYTSSLAKSISADGVSENNATAAYQQISASSTTSTAAVTSITLTLRGTSINFAEFSTASLYIIS